ncbi:hypothetical protein MTO96_006726 [Rhipicephalus appendiculatus]
MMETMLRQLFVFSFSLMITGTAIEDIEDSWKKLKANVTENVPGTVELPTSLGDLLRKLGIKVNTSRCPFEDDLCSVECYVNNTKPLRGHCGGFLWTTCVCEGEYRR